MFWSALAGVSLSLIAFPLRALWDATKFALQASALGVFFLISMPVALGLESSRSVGAIGGAAFAFLFVLPITALITAVGLAVVAGEILLASPFVLLFELASGIVSSCTDGWRGFMNAWSKPSYYEERRWSYLDVLRRVFSFIPRRRPQASDFNALLGVSPAVDELNTAEIEQARSILERHPSPRANSPLKQLKDSMKSYEALNARIQVVRNAIANQNLADLDDDFVGDGVMRAPILLVKEYCLSENNWRSVPSQTYITDREFLKKWLLGSRSRAPGSHPLNREAIFHPPVYGPEGYATRYRIYPLTQEYCSAPELAQRTQQIRQLLRSAEVKAALAPVAENPASVVVPSAPSLEYEAPLAQVGISHVPQGLFHNEVRCLPMTSQPESGSAPCCH